MAHLKQDHGHNWNSRLRRTEAAYKMVARSPSSHRPQTLAQQPDLKSSTSEQWLLLKKATKSSSLSLTAKPRARLLSSNGAKISHNVLLSTIPWWLTTLPPANNAAFSSLLNTTSPAPRTTRNTSLTLESSSRGVSPASKCDSLQKLME